MKILNEFVPTRKFFKLAEELKDLVDGWNVTDSAAGFSAQRCRRQLLTQKQVPRKICLPNLHIAL
jgi:hypothetical protein